MTLVKAQSRRLYPRGGSATEIGTGTTAEGFYSEGEIFSQLQI